LTFTGDHRLVLRAGDEARAIAAALGDVRLSARVGMRRLLACHLPDRVSALAEEGADVVAFADAAGDPQTQVLARGWYCFALQVAGDLRAARARATEAVAISDEAGHPGLRGMSRLWYANAVDALGDHQEAERLTQAGFELCQQAGYSDAIMWYGGRMVQHWAFEGQPELAADVAAQAISEFPRMVVWQSFWAAHLAFAGRHRELAGFMATLPSILGRVPVDMFWLTAHFWFAVAQGFGPANPEAAATIYDRLLPYRSMHAAYAVSYVGPIEVALAVAARLKGDMEAALAHHDAAAATIEACGAARARALNGYQWARTLLARGAPGDRTRATEMAEESLAYCREKGYTTFVEKTEELLCSIS
jgi:hypothetical protein